MITVAVLCTLLQRIVIELPCSLREVVYKPSFVMTSLCFIYLLFYSLVTSSYCVKLSTRFD